MDYKYDFGAKDIPRAEFLEALVAAGGSSFKDGGGPSKPLSLSVHALMATGELDQNAVTTLRASDRAQGGGVLVGARAVIDLVRSAQPKAGR